MLVQGIKSKPVYSPLQPDVRGRSHLMVGFGVGGASLLRVTADLQLVAAEALARVSVLYLEEPGNITGFAKEFTNANIASVRTFGDREQLLHGLEGVLTDSVMGTRLYVAGPESFMGLVMQLAARFNLNQDEVRAEECGSLARRVFCVHCRSVSENVRTNIVQCRCERWLIVRDHYSRRLAAYMGVMVDAEQPGQLPLQREVFV